MKFHWRPKLGLQSTIWDETSKLPGPTLISNAGSCSSKFSAGNFPEWELAVQLFTEQEAAALPFDHLDATKIIPEELVPLQVIGRMVLGSLARQFLCRDRTSGLLPCQHYSWD